MPASSQCDRALSCRTVRELVAASAARSPDAVALAAPDHCPLTYRNLQAQLEYVTARLREHGLGRGDRVAIALRNGPELAAAFVTVSAAAACVPLNPGASDAELDFCLSDLGVKALVLEKGCPGSARAIARDRRIPVLELCPEPQRGAGAFTLDGSAGCRPASGDLSQPGDVALLLHTSGTTSRPKTVPLTQANICASVRHVGQALQLTGDDRCLNVMPLFHIHGLIAGVLASLGAGASVVCTPGFEAGRFFDWLADWRPTWYTAVPTMHQAVVAEAAHRSPEGTDACLRFVRSASAPLPPQVLAALERLFQAPVVEAYGMSEAAHQVCCNPLPPRRRKPGSVGPAAGPEVAVIDEAGNLLPAQATGEIVIRGPNVMRGYENNPGANATSLVGGWLRTGDQGYLDADGYLFITGRIKEIINRGGEKISPREVDEALLDHPAVSQALTFAVPHERLGEDVAAAVVLRAGPAATEADIRRALFARLAAHKVPSRVVFVVAIPKGPTGKPQRIGLHEKLAHLLEPEFLAPAGTIEQVIARVWGEVLKRERLGRHDNFFGLGGDSLLATRAVARLSAAFAVELPPTALFHNPTVADLAAVVEDLLVRAVKGSTGNGAPA